MLRLFIGLLFLILTRLIVKPITMFLLLRITAESNEEPKHRYVIEVPTKFIVYSAIGFITTYPTFLFFIYYKFI